MRETLLLSVWKATWRDCQLMRSVGVILVSLAHVDLSPPMSDRFAFKDVSFELERKTKNGRLANLIRDEFRDSA